MYRNAAPETQHGHPEYITIYNALEPNACASNKSIYEICCLAKAEGGIDFDIGVWLFNPDNWNQTSRGATAIACHTGVHTYAPSAATCYYSTEPEVDVYIPDVLGHYYGNNLGPHTHHGTVTTQFMGVTHGDPNWDDLEDELTARLLKARRQHNPLDTGSLFYPSRLMNNAHRGLTFLTNQLYQLWDRSDTSFILRPSLIGMTSGALKHRVCANPKGHASQRWVYVPYVDAGKSPISQPINTLYDKARTDPTFLPADKLLSEHFSDRVKDRPPNIKLRHATLLRKPVKLIWSETKFEDQTNKIRQTIPRQYSNINLYQDQQNTVVLRHTGKGMSGQLPSGLKLQMLQLSLLLSVWALLNCTVQIQMPTKCFSHNVILRCTLVLKLVFVYES